VHPSIEQPTACIASTSAARDVSSLWSASCERTLIFMSTPEWAIFILTTTAPSDSGASSIVKVFAGAPERGAAPWAACVAAAPPGLASRVRLAAMRLRACGASNAAIAGAGFVVGAERSIRPIGSAAACRSSIAAASTLASKAARAGEASAADDAGCGSGRAISPSARRGSAPDEIGADSIADGREISNAGSAATSSSTPRSADGGDFCATIRASRGLGAAAKDRSERRSSETLSREEAAFEGSTVWLADGGEEGGGSAGCAVRALSGTARGAVAVGAGAGAGAGASATAGAAREPRCGSDRTSAISGASDAGGSVAARGRVGAARGCVGAEMDGAAAGVLTVVTPVAASVRSGGEDDSGVTAGGFAAMKRRSSVRSVRPESGAADRPTISSRLVTGSSDAAGVSGVARSGTAMSAGSPEAGGAALWRCGAGRASGAGSGECSARAFGRISGPATRGGAAPIARSSPIDASSRDDGSIARRRSSALAAKAPEPDGAGSGDAGAGPISSETTRDGSEAANEGCAAIDGARTGGSAPNAIS
jgi:hypothetical protein